MGFGFKTDMIADISDGSLLPPLSNLATPDRSRRLDSQQDQYINDSDFKKSKVSISNATPPTFPKTEEAERNTLRDSMKSKQYSFNAEAVRKIEEAKEAAFERIMHSANIVKEVLQRNMALSEDLVKNNEAIDNLNQEIFQLQRENEDLRERLEILETITGKDSSILLGKLKNVNQTIDTEEQEEELELEQRKNKEEMKQFSEKDLMMLLTDENNSDDFMVKNKQSIINTIYQLGKDKQILVKRIENLEKSRIRKTHMKLRMTNNEFYQGNLVPNYDSATKTNYYGQAVNDQIRFKATLDEGVDDVEPIRSILNEDDLIVPHNFQQQLKKGKTNKLKIAKQTSLNKKRVLPLKKRASDNQSSKSEIRNVNSFNYGANIRKGRDSFY